MTTSEYLLAGDIGATKTALALFRLDKGLQNPLAEDTVDNTSGSGFEDIVQTFLDGVDSRPEYACFGVAGPVGNNRVNMTNLDWSLSGDSLQQQLGIRSVILVNDLVATAMGAVHLPSRSLFTLNAGKRDPGGAVAVLAPGTGLGEAFLVKNRDRWLPVPSEGGHSSFAPADSMQRRLLQYMTKRYSHVSTEMVCSGKWLPFLYAFLCEEQGTVNLLAGLEDPTPIIVEAALEDRARRGEGAAADTLRLFVNILAAESANLALKVLATGGLYIGGGMPPRILPFLQGTDFMDFFSRGDYADMLAAMPVHVILEPKTALFGAAAYGRYHFNIAGSE